MDTKTVVILGVVGVGLLAMLAGGSAPSPSPSPTPPGPSPDVQPTSWRRMVDSELVPSEVQYAVTMNNDAKTYGNEQIHEMPQGWRRWLREGGNTTVWRPSSDPMPSGGGGQPVANNTNVNDPTLQAAAAGLGLPEAPA